MEGPIREPIGAADAPLKAGEAGVSLSTSYLGLTLKNPLIASASPLNAKLDNLRRLEDAGAAAIVLPSLFEEQIEAEAAKHEALMDAYANSSPEAASYFPASSAGPYGLVPERYLDLIRRGSAAVSIPLIASLNGSSLAGWVDYARLIEQAGASALELNMYHVPTDLTESGHDVEARYTGIVTAVCASIELPVSLKLTPHLSSIGNFAVTLADRGAQGVVLFNRLLEPDIDLVRLSLIDRLELSDPAELRLPLLWSAILAGRTSLSIAASTGVASADDVVKCLLAGADAVMTTSALLRHDLGFMSVLEAGLRRWMAAREISSLDQMRGMLSWERSSDRTAYTRANYLRILERYAAG